MISQYSENGTTTFTLSELQSNIGWSANEDTARSRLETLRTVGFVELNSAGREYQYTLREPLTVWTADSSMTDLPKVGPSRSIVSTPGDQEPTRWFSPNLNLPEPTSERLWSYAVTLSVSAVVCLVATTLLILSGHQLGFIGGVILLAVAWGFVSIAGAILIVRTL